VVGDKNVTRASDTLWYFAYGSNLALSTLVGRRGLAPLESHVAWVDDWELRFDLPVGPGERAVANLAAAPGARTWGVAYRITTADAARLDRTEGVDRGYYVRLAVAARRPEAADPLAAYTYQSPHGTAGRKPSARYLGIILEGARHHALPAAWIAYLERLELAVDERLAGGKP
jgi:cation transport regulator ChaC